MGSYREGQTTFLYKGHIFFRTYSFTPYIYERKFVFLLHTVSMCTPPLVEGFAEEMVLAITHIAFYSFIDIYRYKHVLPYVNWFLEHNKIVINFRTHCYFRTRV